MNVIDEFKDLYELHNAYLHEIGRLQDHLTRRIYDHEGEILARVPTGSVETQGCYVKPENAEGKLRNRND